MVAPTRLRMATASLVLAALALTACGSDGGDGGKTTTTKPRATTTTVAASTTSTTAVESTATAVWPWASSTTRYSDPVEAVRGFAVDFVGFTDPVLGEFRQGDTRSGEVEVRAKATSAPSTVFVRQINDSWWVLGASTADIQPSAPAAGASVASPLALSGSSTAFEATVNVRLVADGATPATSSGDSGATLANGPWTNLATGFVMGGSMGDMGPYSGSLTFTSPGAGTSGTLLMVTLSAEDGRVLIVSATRLHF